jgi:hypothetical protein
MKKTPGELLFILFTILLFASCKSGGVKEAKYIPKEAGFVLVLNQQQMQDKLQKGGISIDTLIGKVFKTDSSDKKDKEKFTELRSNAGINWDSQLFFFMQQKSFADNSQATVVSLMCSLNDKLKLEAFLTKQDEMKGKEIRKEKDFSYLLGEEGTMLAWNDEQVIATFYTHTQKAVYDTAAMTFKKPSAVNREEEMKKEVTHYFTQKISESLADQPIFTGMFKEKADGYVFTSANNSLSALSMMPFQLPKLEDLIKDNYSVSTLSFEDGKIIAKSTSYTNKLLSNILQQYAGPVVNLSMVEKYPSEHVNGIMLASFNPEIFGGILKQLEVEGLVNATLEKTGLSSQELYKSLKGDIAVIVSDLGMNETPAAMHGKATVVNARKPLGKMIFDAPVGDKASFQKIMDKGVEQGILIKQGSTYKAGKMLAFLGVYIQADEKSLVVSSDSLTYAQYKAGTGHAVINQEVIDKMKGKSTAFYFDIASTINGFIGKDSTAVFHQSMTTAKNTFRDVIATSDNFDGKSIKATLEIRMQNEKQNSLVTLTSLLTDIAVDMRVQAKREKEMEEKMFPGGVPAIIRTN